MSNKLIPFGFLMFESGLKAVYNKSVEVERHKFSTGIYCVLFDDHIIRVINPNGENTVYSLIVPTVYRYCNIYGSDVPNVFWHDTVEAMDAKVCSDRNPFHSYLRGEFDGEELINVEIIKR